MELTRQPETELEYWAVIEDLGGFTWSINHDIGHGRIKSSPEIARDLLDARNIQELLVSELFVKFGVVHLKDCPRVKFDEKMPEAPSGMKWYWDWYNEMKRKAYELEYNGIICSACPFSKGVEEMIGLGGKIPCGIFKGMLYRLSAPHICAICEGICGTKWSVDQFYSKILNEHGQKALDAFKVKKEELEISTSEIN